MIPLPVRTLFHLLSRSPWLPHLSDMEWRELLAFADRTQLTLHLGGKAGLPPWLDVEIEARRVRNMERRRRLRETFAEIEHAFNAAAVEFVILKGFTHESGFGIYPNARVQYDLDLLCAPAELSRARDTLRTLGYLPHGGKSLSDEHSRPLVRPFTWAWRGDYFDPEMPIAVELHDSIWNATHDRFHIDTAAFWNRRSGNSLARTDVAGFAALHVLRHALRQDARPAHAYELARLLQTRDALFWRDWIEHRDPRLRGLESVGLRFASEWFSCALPEAVDREWLRQPGPVKDWFREFAWSPIANILGRNKDSIWLHLALLERGSDRMRVFCHRMTPLRLPHHANVWERGRYHAGAFALAFFNGLRWWWRRRVASTASHISNWNRGSV